MKRPILYWVILFILGEVLYKRCSIYMVGFLGVAFLIYVVINRRREKRWVLQIVGAVCFFLGVFCMHSWNRIANVCDIQSGTNVLFEGKVLKKEETTYDTSYIVKLKRLNGENITVKAQIYFQEDYYLKLGSSIKGEGVVRKFSESSNPGGYDEMSYKYGNGILLSLEKAKLVRVDTALILWRDYLDKVQGNLAKVFSDLFDDKRASLATAMVLGDKKNLDADIKMLYQRNGIAHLIAISGLHIAMIGGTLYKCLRRLTGSFSIAASIGVIFIVSYGVMTGLSGATYRAVIMLVMSIGADVFGRKYDGLTAVALALLIMLVNNPYQITQVGFLLSFGAVLGIVLIHPMWKQWSTKIPKCLDGLFVSISVQLVLTPIMLYHFYEIPLYSIFLNVIVVPLMNILLAMLIFCGVIGVFSVGLALIPAYIADGIFAFYEMLCCVMERLPGHTLCTGKPEVWWIVLYYVFLAIGVYFSYGNCKRVSKVFLVLLMLSFGVFLLPTQVKICMFDVGQGDAIYIRTKYQRHVLIDGGSSSKNRIGQYVLKNGLKYYGAATIDYLFVTHSDSDHYSGVKELLEDELIEVDNMVFPAISNPDKAYLELVDLAKKRGCAVYYMKKGDFLELDGVLFQCLNPLQQIYEDKNEGCIVLQMNYGDFDMLLTGDLNVEAEQSILNDITDTVEVLKVAHHGSATSTSDAFLRKLRPAIACISVAERNRYGHPSKEVMERLRQYTRKIYLTKDSGAITIETDGIEYFVDVFLQ